jgi:hypothetical protein
MSTMLPDRNSTSQGFTLLAGEQRVLRVAAGSRCLVTRGELRLIEPVRWLGERIVRLDRVLGEGAEHVLEQGGWVTLRALTDGALLLEAPASLASAVLGAWRVIRPRPATS